MLSIRHFSEEYHDAPAQEFNLRLIIIKKAIFRGDVYRALFLQ
jgi:hypothetical protein